MVITDERFCVPIRDGLPGAVVAEPLSCVVDAVDLAAPQLADDVVIIGAGFMGNLLQLVAQLKGSRTVTVVDVRQEDLNARPRLARPTPSIAPPEARSPSSERSQRGGAPMSVTSNLDLEDSRGAQQGAGVSRAIRSLSAIPRSERAERQVAAVDGDQSDRTSRGAREDARRSGMRTGPAGLRLHQRVGAGNSDVC
jgi:hypothetical protein